MGNTQKILLYLNTDIGLLVFEPPQIICYDHVLQDICMYFERISTIFQSSIIMYLLSTCLNLITVPTINESWDVIRKPNFPQNFPCSHECGFSIKIIWQARLLTSPEMCPIPEAIVQFSVARHGGRSTKFTNKSAGCIAHHTVCHKTMKVTAENFQNVKYLYLE